MKPKRWILVLCALALLATTPLQASASFSGNDLFQWMGADERIEAGKSNPEDISHSFMYLGYIAGVRDVTCGIYWSAQGTQLRQCVAIVTKYLKAHPERWNYNAAILVTEALAEAFPKKDAK